MCLIQLMVHLAASIWRVQLTAMGLIPPPHLDKAIRDAPKKFFFMKSGVPPRRIMLMEHR